MPNFEGRPLVILVHGFGSDARCWKPFLDLLRQDPEISHRFEFACFEYPTKWFSWNPLGRIPELKELGKLLDGYLKVPLREGREITLIGHSQGGLVIFSCLADRLRDNKAETLDNIRQVVTLATPFRGSVVARGMRNLVSRFLPNPQERTLRVLNAEIADLMAFIRERVENANEATASSYPIPCRAFAGVEDNVVPEASARGPFGSFESIPGDHFAVLRPTGTSDLRYVRIRDTLLHPVGHQHVFEIERYETRIIVEPLGAVKDIEVQHGNKSRIVQTDNVGRIERTVLFSQGNRCFREFEIRYSTRNDGYIEPKANVTNATKSKNIGIYKDYGVEYVLEFRPQPEDSKTYELAVKVYKGFEEGNRDAHFHLGHRRKFYYHLHYRLDLSAYVLAGYAIAEQPQLYHHDTDPEDHDICGQRTLTDPRKPSHVDPAGVWEWEFEEVRDGVIDIVWEPTLQPSAGA